MTKVEANELKIKLEKYSEIDSVISNLSTLLDCFTTLSNTTEHRGIDGCPINPEACRYLTCKDYGVKDWDFEQNTPYNNLFINHELAERLNQTVLDYISELKKRQEEI